jgi:CRP-like cAMP-binding protein
MALNAALKYDTRNSLDLDWQAQIFPSPAGQKTPVIKPVIKQSLRRLPVLLAPEQTSNKLLLSLPRDVFSRLRPEMKSVYFERGETIYEIGGSFDFVYFPNNNLVASRLALTEDGAMIEVGVIGREGLLGVTALTGARLANNTTIAETDGSAVRIRAKILIDAFRSNFKLQNILLAYYNDFLTQISQRAACRCRHSVAQQLCTWLLQIQDRAGTNDLILTQETIAHRLGARRASITVAINELEKAGLLNCKRGHIVICNRGGLEKQACECYGLLSASFETALHSDFVQ